MILVVGATGNAGSEVCRLLTGGGKNVRALVRETSDQEKVSNLERMGVTFIQGDLRDPSSLGPALENIETVITTASAMPFSYIPGENNMELVDRIGMKGLINSAVKAGVRHFIYTSFSNNIDQEFPLSNAKRDVENHLQNSGMIYTILRSGYFMEAWLTSLVGFDFENAKVQLCGDGTKKISYISMHDVAKFCVESLNNKTAENRILELGGPQALSQFDVVQVFEEISGKKFEVQHIPIDALQLQMDEAADPMQKSFSGLMLCLANGDPIDMDEILKEFPLTLKSVEEYARSILTAS